MLYVAYVNTVFNAVGEAQTNFSLWTIKYTILYSTQFLSELQIQSYFLTVMFWAVGVYGQQLTRGYSTWCHAAAPLAAGA